MYDRFDCSFVSSKEDAQNTLMRIVGYISECVDDLEAEDLYDLKLIFSELLFNAAIHGNKLDRKKKVSVTVEISGRSLYSSIRDEGEGFDYMSKLRPEHRFSDERLEGESGRGISLVFAMTDSLDFNFSGNEIRFRKELG